MGRYSGSSSQRESSISKPKAPHEIWRGIGCLMMLGIPAISIAAGKISIDYAVGNHWPIPHQLLGYPVMPDIAFKLRGLYTILKPATEVQHLYAIAAVSIIYMIIISGLISVIYAAIYSMVGPSRYGPTDAPPPKVKITKKSR